MVPGLLVWLGVSLATYAVVLNAAWIVRHLSDAAIRSPGRFDDPRMNVSLRAAYWLGVPAAALALRVPGLRASNLGLPPVEAMGGPWFDRLAGFGPTLALALALAVFVLFVMLASHAWFERSRARAETTRSEADPPALRRQSPAPTTPARPGLSPRAGHREVARVRVSRLTPADWGWLALGALCLEAHWAFFRAGALSLGFDNATLGVFLALGLLGLEAWADPAARGAWHDGAALARHALGASLATLSALVFLVTGSFAACLAAHLVAGAGFALSPATAGNRDVEPATAGGDDLPAIEPTVV